MKVIIVATVTVLVVALAGSLALNVYYYNQAGSLASRLETANVGVRFLEPDDSPLDVLKMSEVNRQIDAVIHQRDEAVVALREIELEMHDPRNFGRRWRDARPGTVRRLGVTRVVRGWYRWPDGGPTWRPDSERLRRFRR